MVYRTRNWTNGCLSSTILSVNPISLPRNLLVSFAVALTVAEVLHGAMQEETLFAETQEECSRDDEKNGQVQYQIG